jgi:hypothetical protein
MTRKYEQITAYRGEWAVWFAPNLIHYRLACCDCGLVHEVQFRYRKRTSVQIRFKKNNRATAAMRRSKKYKKYRSKK